MVLSISPVSPGEAASGNYDSRLVRVEGRLIGRDVAAINTSLILSSGKFIFTAVLPKNLTKSEEAEWSQRQQASDYGNLHSEVGCSGGRRSHVGLRGTNVVPDPYGLAQ